MAVGLANTAGIMVLVATGIVPNSSWWLRVLAAVVTVVLLGNLTRMIVTVARCWPGRSGSLRESPGGDDTPAASQRLAVRSPVARLRPQARQRAWPGAWPGTTKAEPTELREHLGAPYR